MKIAFCCSLVGFAIAPALAQDPHMGPEYPLTIGEYDDHHPVVLHGEYFDADEWLVFERHSEVGPFIAGRRLSPSPDLGQMAVANISKNADGEEETLPDYTHVQYAHHDSTVIVHDLRVAAWQRKTRKGWNIYYSVLRDTQATWSDPLPLTDDTIGNTHVQLRIGPGPPVMFTWVRGRAIVCSFMDESGFSPIDTVAVSSIDTPDYDVVLAPDNRYLVWIAVDSTGRKILLKREFDQMHQYGISRTDTLRFEWSVSDPHLAAGVTGNYALFDAPVKSVSNIFSWGLPGMGQPLQQVDTLSDDSIAINRNAHAYTVQYMLLGAAKSSSSHWPRPYFDVLAWERQVPGDTALVFQGEGVSDTVRSQGYNRDVCVGWATLFDSSGFYVLAVWESNRTGRSHIYGRRIYPTLLAVPDHEPTPQTYELLPNYPNPFNPTTVITYRLPVVSEVKLVVYDLLGREEAVLVNERQNAGSHEVKFDAAGLSSGVYFYRLQAGSFAETRKLLLLR